MTTGRGTLSVVAGAVAVALATVGYVLSPPSFDPPPLTAPLSLPAQPAPETRHVNAIAPIWTENISVPAKGEVLHATIRSPMTSGRHPAMAFVQGSGSGNRREFDTQAEWLARAGIVTIAWDKRTVGYSFRNRDFSLLADDALRMLEVLRKRPDVDLSRTGLWSVSEGSWVAPIAAAKSSDVRFLVMVSAPVVSPMRQVAWALNEQLLRLHAPEGVRDLLARAMGGVGFNFLRFDSVPELKQVTQPVLALYGTGDPSIPFVESMKTLTASLPTKDYTIRFFADANHAMRLGIGGSGKFSPAYLPTLANWIEGLPGTARPAVPIAGATPVQRFEASDVPAAPWYGATTMLGLTVFLAAVGYVAAPVTEMVVRLRGRDERLQASARLWPGIRRRLRRMAWTGLGLLVTVLAFVSLIVLFAVNQAGAWPAVQAGWLVIRVLAVVMLAQEVSAAAAVIRGLRDGWQPTRWQKVTLTGVLGGTGLLLVAAAYYGLFALPW